MLPLGHCQRLLRVLQGGRQLPGLCLQAQGCGLGMVSMGACTSRRVAAPAVHGRAAGSWQAPACRQTVQNGSGVQGLQSEDAELRRCQRPLQGHALDHSWQEVMLLQGSRQPPGLPNRTRSAKTNCR